jgi:hypothetical protein
MYRILTHTALTATLATFAFAQAPQTTDQQPAPRQTETSSTAPTSSGQTYKGVLMDASCQAIQSRSAATTSSDVTRSRPAADSSTATLNMPRSTASAAEAGKAATSATTTATTGVATDQSGQATATNRTTTIGRDTEKSSSSKSSSSVKTYDGTTATGERSRPAHTNPDVQWTTVREKYKDCKVSPTTTSFAIMSNGQLYMLDGASDALKQRTSSNTPSDWHRITVVGNMTGDRITVTSVR